MVRISMPNSPTARTARRNASTPRRWPSTRGKPRSAAQRPLPSMMMATWRGGSTPSLPSPACGGALGGGGTAGCVALGEVEASGILFTPTVAARNLNRHDFFFLARKGPVDVGYDLVRRLLNLARHAGVVVLADLAVFCELR